VGGEDVLCVGAAARLPVVGLRAAGRHCRVPVPLSVLDEEGVLLLVKLHKGERKDDLSIR
jgi:hypothetical protein